MVLFTLVLVSLMASRNAELRRWRHSNKIILGELNLLENPLLMGTELQSNTTLEAAGWSSSSEKEPTDTGNSSEQETNPCEADGDISPISSASDYHEPSDCDIEHDEPLQIIPISSVLASWATTHIELVRRLYTAFFIY